MMRQHLLFAVIIIMVVLSGCSTRNEVADRSSYAPHGGRAGQGSIVKQPDSRKEMAGQRAELPVTLVKGTVTRVVDGDTVYVSLSGNRTEKVRFIGIDTPETKPKPAEPYGKEAAKYTYSLINGRQVWLEVDIQERDKYGRLLAYVWLSPPDEISDSEIRTRMLNADLLLNGYAQLLTVPPNVKYAAYFRRYQAEAREKKHGLYGFRT